MMRASMNSREADESQELRKSKDCTAQNHTNLSFYVSIKIRIEVLI
jgi:hypothetical protein